MWKEPGGDICVDLKGNSMRIKIVAFIYKTIPGF